MSKWNREQWANHKTRKKLSKAIAKAQGTPEMRALYSRIRIEDWQRPEYREKMVAAVRKSHSRPEYRAFFSQALKERWNDPALRAKYTAANAARNNPEHRERCRQLMLKRWREDEQFRALVQASNQIYWSNPENREFHRDRMKALWADPISRLKIMSGLARNSGSVNGRVYRHIESANDLVAEVDALIPKALPEYMRADVCQDIVLALLEGQLRLDELKANWRGFLTAHRQMFPDKWGPISIDAPLPGTDGFTIADTLSNESPHF